MNSCRILFSIPSQFSNTTTSAYVSKVDKHAHSQACGILLHKSVSLSVETPVFVGYCITGPHMNKNPIALKKTLF